MHKPEPPFESNTLRNHWLSFLDETPDNIERSDPSDCAETLACFAINLGKLLYTTSKLEPGHDIKAECWPEKPTSLTALGWQLWQAGLKLNRRVRGGRTGQRRSSSERRMDRLELQLAELHATLVTVLRLHGHLPSEPLHRHPSIVRVDFNEGGSK